MWKTGGNGDLVAVNGQTGLSLNGQPDGGSEWVLPPSETPRPEWPGRRTYLVSGHVRSCLARNPRYQLGNRPVLRDDGR
jgi:hypothetical protein